MRVSFLKVSCSLAILLVVAGSIVVISRSQETAEVYTTEVIRSPLSTMPAPVLVGQQFTLTVAVAQSAAQWSVAIESKYNSYGLNVLPLGHDSSEGVWRLNATVSTSVQPGLYALEVSVVLDGKNSTYTQPRSVWVMSDYPKEFRIAQLSDVHYALKPEHLRQAIAQLNFLRPTFAVITGDIADVGSSEREVQGFWTALQDADFPTYCVPGNHDYQGGGESNYIKYEGPLNYSVNLGFACLIALDTDFERAYVNIEQTEWARRMLSTVSANEFKIIAFHHPFFGNTLFSTATNITGSWEAIQDLQPIMYGSWIVTEQALTAAKEFLRLVQEYNVNLILQGHIHRDQIFILNQKNHFVVTTTLGGPHAASMPYGYRMIDVKDGRITGLTYLNRPLSSLSTGDRSQSIPLELLEVGYGPENDGS
ncbi:MAG: metallophosphoesterase, partial [Aigarchaeota archaeon]|nr:metallophosphoesterase [Aigarchaeota archaeon]